MSRKPHFSVIIPVHDRSVTIDPTLRSVIAQSDGDFECLIVDDGSADGSALRHVVEALGDPRFRLIVRENGGGGAARNTGILAARGRYLAFLDSDDRFLPDKLAAFRAWFAARPDARAAYSPFLADRGAGRIWVRPDRGIGADEDVGEYLFVANQFIQTSTIVIEREAATRTLFDPALRKGQDLDFCLRLQAHAVRFAMLPQPLTIFADKDESRRTSRTPGYDAPLAWLGQHRPLLTRRAYRGYRATVLAYYMAKARPLTAARDLLIGLVSARVPPKVIARQALRGYLPRAAYRRLVDGFLRLRARGRTI